MSVRVVARIRPLLDAEFEKDVIVHVDSKEGSKKPNIVKIPNPKNESEEFSFAFNGVYDQATTQDELFTAEGKSLLYLGPHPQISTTMLTNHAMLCSCTTHESSLPGR